MINRRFQGFQTQFSFRIDCLRHRKMSLRVRKGVSRETDTVTDRKMSFTFTNNVRNSVFHFLWPSAGPPDVSAGPQEVNRQQVQFWFGFDSRYQFPFKSDLVQVPQLSYFGSSSNSSSTEIHRSIPKSTFKLLFVQGSGSTFVKTAINLPVFLGKQVINPNSVNNNSWSWDTITTLDLA